MRYARTYGSINQPHATQDAWQYPTAPSSDTFGVPILDANKTFGLEEFNFNPHLIKEKIAYIPCYATARYYPRPYMNELRLILKTSGSHHIHYATLYDVSPILDNEIKELRNQIIPVIENIYFGKQTQDFFGVDFENFVTTLNRMRDSDIIASNHDHSPFLVNVRYKKLEILKNPKSLKTNPRNVNQWKINVEFPLNHKT